MLVGQERLPVTSEPREVRVVFPDLEKFESDIQSMLKVVDKHLELSGEDEKVCELTPFLFCPCVTFLKTEREFF